MLGCCDVFGVCCGVVYGVVVGCSVLDCSCIVVCCSVVYCVGCVLYCMCSVLIVCYCIVV